MANPEHLEKLKEGWIEWNAWRRSIQYVDLSDADLRNTTLQLFDLSRTQFTGANLEEANLWNTNCVGADFSGANLRGAFLVRMNATYANFKGADLTNAIAGHTVFAAASLNRAQISKMAHVTPSTIGIDTFFNSGGLPENFLRGCGVPEEFIAYAGSLIGQPIEYYSCFISYSSNDDEFAHRLHDGLQGRKVRTWFAPEDLKIGDRFRSRIDESIRIHDKLVLILSEHSINSAWVQREVETALEREDKEKRDLLFPIRLDDSVFDSDAAWARDVCRRHIGDFRNWKSHDDYTKAFERLVKDLKKEGPIIMKA